MAYAIRPMYPVPVSLDGLDQYVQNSAVKTIPTATTMVSVWDQILVCATLDIWVTIVEPFPVLVRHHLILKSAVAMVSVLDLIIAPVIVFIIQMWTVWINLLNHYIWSSIIIIPTW
jgi:hypothetical protein